MFLIKKALRYLSIYGLWWTLFKIGGRTRKLPIRIVFGPPKIDTAVGIIGCGQFSYSTTANFLYRKYGKVVKACLDLDSGASASYASSLGVKNSYTSFDEFIENKLDVVYIASNHYSHAEYAIKCMEAGVSKVYIEKPIAVNEEQLRSIANASRKSEAKIYAGFNRPFSQGVVDLKNNLKLINQRYFMSMIVWGHMIDGAHWYRDPKEGSRISGNLAHWVDLMVHVLSWKDSIPEYYDVVITWLDASSYRDENFVMTVNTSNGDIFTFQFGAKINPFDGVSELIDFQCDNFCSRIIDFTRMEIDTGNDRKIKRFFPKDAGHKSAILQPFQSDYPRKFNEVLFSTGMTIVLGKLFEKNIPKTRLYSKDIESIYFY
jgi:predicted dehydrogenase